MQTRAPRRQRRTVLRSIIAECDHVIEFPRQILHALGPLRRDVDPTVAHSLERKRIDPGRMRPRTRHFDTGSCERPCQAFGHLDRKSTRLNSSHGYISYAVFCLKKKNKLKLSTVEYYI